MCLSDDSLASTKQPNILSAQWVFVGLVKHEIADFIKTNTQYFGVSYLMSLMFVFNLLHMLNNQSFRLMGNVKKKRDKLFCHLISKILHKRGRLVALLLLLPACNKDPSIPPLMPCTHHHHHHQKRSGPWEKNAWNVCKAYVNFTSPGEESIVTMKGHRGENNVITCYPDTKAPLNTFPQCYNAENSVSNQTEAPYL